MKINEIKPIPASELEGYSLKQLQPYYRKLTGHDAPKGTKKADLRAEILRLQGNSGAHSENDESSEGSYANEGEEDELSILQEPQSKTPQKKDRKRRRSSTPGNGSPAGRNGSSVPDETTSTPAAKKARKTPSKTKTPRASKAAVTKGLNLNSTAIEEEDELFEEGESEEEEHEEGEVSDDNDADGNHARAAMDAPSEASETPKKAKANQTRAHKTIHVSNNAEGGNRTSSSIPSIPQASQTASIPSPAAPTRTQTILTRHMEIPTFNLAPTTAASISKEVVHKIVNETLETKKKELEGLIDAASEMQSRGIDDLKKQLAGLEVDVLSKPSKDDLETKVDMVIEANKIAITSSKIILEEKIENKFNGIKGQLVGETKKNLEESKRITDVQESVQAIRQSLNSQIQTIFGIQSGLKAAQSSISTLEHDVKQEALRSELVSLIGDLEKFVANETGNLKTELHLTAATQTSHQNVLSDLSAKVQALEAVVDDSVSQTQFGDLNSTIASLSTEQGKIAARVEMLQNSEKDKATTVDVLKLQSLVEEHVRDSRDALESTENRMLASQDASTSSARQEVLSEIKKAKELLGQKVDAVEASASAQAERLAALRPEIEAFVGERIRQVIEGEVASRAAQQHAATQAEIRRLKEEEKETLENRLKATSDSLSASLIATVDQRIGKAQIDNQDMLSTRVGEAMQQLHDDIAASQKNLSNTLHKEIDVQQTAISAVAANTNSVIDDLKSTAHTQILNSHELRDKLKLMVKNEVAPIDRKVQLTSGLAEYTAALVRDTEKMINEKVAEAIEKHAPKAASNGGKDGGDIARLERIINEMAKDLRETKLELRNLKVR